MPTDPDANPVLREGDPTPDAPIALAPREKQKPPAPFGIPLTNITDAWQFAQNLAKSDLVPKAFRDRPADVLAAMQLGAELGLAPMQALQSVAVVNGKPTLYGDGLLAVIFASTLYLDHREYYEDAAGTQRDRLTEADLEDDRTAAVCVFLRAGQPNPTIRKFSIGQAKRAGLWKKDGPWSTYPDRMLRMRARSWAARDTFADLLRGLRAAEEIEDEPDDTPPAPRRVPRLSDPHDFTDRTAATRAGAPTPNAAPTVDPTGWHCPDCGANDGYTADCPRCRTRAAADANAEVF
jgi:hypothetical protein